MDRIPLVDISGPPFEAGVMLGYTWKEALHAAAASRPAEERPWWTQRPGESLIARHAPHLTDLYRGMAKGAGLPEFRCFDASASGPVRAATPADGCTSFAVHPSITLDGVPLSGQTKDTPRQQQFRYLVLRLKLEDAPQALTLTYPGLLFGHGFVTGGCAVFRNSLYAGVADGNLDLTPWGLLALHCRTVDEVIELTRRHGVRVSGHFTVADEDGGIAGIEIAKGGIAVLRPRRGLYTHANTVSSGRKRLLKHETKSPFNGENSRQRENRLRERLDTERGRLTAPLAMTALTDHTNHPRGICRHESDQAMTTAATVAEPTRRRLHCTRGAPCRHWPHTFRL